MRKVFVSYSRKQGEWVWDRLYPCLVAGGVEVLIDKKRFQAGVAVYDQMDSTQDLADVHLLVLSPDYLSSKACRWEMGRAIATDPEFDRGRVIPVVRESCELPEEIKRADPLWVDLTDDKRAEPWDLVMQGCGAELGVNAAEWLRARAEVLTYLRRGQSVNLVVRGEPRRREFFERVREDLGGKLPLVDLDRGVTAPRRGLVEEILRECGSPAKVPKEDGEDLALLDARVSELGKTILCFRHFDRVVDRKYGNDFFSTLKYLVMDERKLVLLVESRTPCASLLPDDPNLTKIETKLVEFRSYGRTATTQ